MLQENRPKLLIYIIIAAGFIGGYMYFSQGGEIVSQVPEVRIVENGLENFKDLKIDFSLLENDKIKSLKLFGESPVLPGVAGKKNIFAPAE